MLTNDEVRNEKITKTNSGVPRIDPGIESREAGTLGNLLRVR